MVTEMTKYGFILLSGDAEVFLKKLQGVGMVDITRSTKPIDEPSEKLSYRANILRKALSALKTVTPSEKAGEKITDVAGASAVFECGVCSYSNRIKHEILGVSEETLAVYTEYSHECAKEMAQGIRRLAQADIGIATTGLAGPGGGIPEQPVGTVYVGISTEHDTKSVLFSFDSTLSRSAIRELAAEKALSLALDTLEQLF